MAKRVPTGKAWIYRDGKRQGEFICPEPTRLSKAGEWALAHPNGIGKILDHRAVNR